MGVSYSKRALAKDYEELIKAEEILGQQDWTQYTPRPDINRDGLLIFVIHEQPSNRVTQDLIKAGWHCQEQYNLQGVTYQYTKARASDYSSLLLLVALVIDMAGMAAMVGVMISWKLLEYGIVWFEPGTFTRRIHL